MASVLMLTCSINDIQGVLFAVNLDVLTVRILDCRVVSVWQHTKRKGENVEAIGSIVCLGVVYLGAWTLLVVESNMNMVAKMLDPSKHMATLSFDRT